MALQACKGSFWIYLIRTTIGEELETAERIEKIFAERSEESTGSRRPLIQSRIFFSVGDYDLVVAASGRTGQSTLLEAGTIEGVVNVQEVACDAISPNGDCADLDLFNDAQLCSVTFARLRCAVLRVGNKPEVEREFLEWWEREERPSSLLLMSLGGPQFAIIRQNESMDSFAEWITKLSPGNPVVQGSWTLLAISKAAYVAALRGELARNANFHLGALPEGSEVQMQLAWSPMLDVAELSRTAGAILKDLGGDTVTFCHTGQEDYTLVVRGWNSHEGGLAKFLQVLIQFRQKIIQSVRYTNTRFLMIPEQIRGGFSNSALAAPVGGEFLPLGEGFVIKSKEARTILRGLSTSGRAVLGFLYSFSNVVTNEDALDRVYDAVVRWRSILDLAHEYAEEALEKGTTEQRRREIERLVAKVVRYAREGLNQRLRGHRGSLLAGGDPSTLNMLGGIDRVLQAAQSIPTWISDKILEAANARDIRSEEGAQLRPWTGLVHVGTHDDYAACDTYFITLPDVHVYRPNRWVSLAHETGHGLYFANRGTERKKGVFWEIDDGLAKLGLDPEYFGNELLPDLIHFHFGPCWESGVKWWFIEYWQYVREIHGGGPDDRSLLWLRPLVIYELYRQGLHCHGNGAEPLDLFGAKTELGHQVARWSEELKDERERSLELETAPDARAVIAERYDCYLQSLEFGRAELGPGDEGVRDDLYWPLDPTALETAIACFRRYLPFDQDQLDERRQWWDDVRDVAELCRPTDLYDRERISELVRYPILFLWKLWMNWPGSPKGRALDDSRIEKIPIPERATVFSALTTLCREQLRMRIQDAAPGE